MPNNQVTISQSLQAHLNNSLEDIVTYAAGRILEPQLGSIQMYYTSAYKRFSAIIEAMDRQKDLYG